jgi:hypothetical protein
LTLRLGGSWFVASPAAATSFNPSAAYCLDDANTAAACDGNNEPGANADLLRTFSIPAPDSNFADLVDFTPPGWGIARDADIANGSVVAELSFKRTISIGAGGCNTSVRPTFNLIDASTDTADTIDYHSDPAGRPNDLLIPLAQDKDNSGIPDGAEKYPSFLKNIPQIVGLTPIARQFGWQDIAGQSTVVEILIFERGTVFPGVPALNAGAGYPSVTVLDDPTAAPSAGLIGDVCTPLAIETRTFGLARQNACVGAPGAPGCGDPTPTALPAKNRRSVVVGDASTQKYRTNPASDGAYVFATLATSLRDADDDGIENQLDACPLTPDPQFDPRQAVSPGDLDGDGIPNSCDPTPDVPPPLPPAGPPGPCPSAGFYDEDFDCYSNRLDNCPLVKNGVDKNGNIVGADDQKDTDGDGIGDACDPNPTVPDGHNHQVCIASSVTIGSGGPAADACAVAAASPPSSPPSLTQTTGQTPAALPRTGAESGASNHRDALLIVAGSLLIALTATGGGLIAWRRSRRNWPDRE